jgi:hypothetical protein
MKRLLYLLLIIAGLTAPVNSQVINFGKTLPMRAFSLTVAPAYNVGNFYHPFLKGVSYVAMAGYGIGYDIDVNLKYAYFNNGSDFIGADLQYLFRETRKSYYSFFGGFHKWEEYGIDLTLSYTHTPQYWANLSVGLDLDVDFSNQLELRAWIPLNFGINLDDRYFLFFEYNLPATERAWDILTAGVTFIFR